MPGAGAEIEMVGLHAGGSVTTSLPRLRVVAGFVIGSGGTLDLAPRMLVLEPELGRMSLVFRKLVHFDSPPVTAAGQECRVRLRLEEGFAELVRV